LTPSLIIFLSHHITSFFPKTYIISPKTIFFPKFILFFISFSQKSPILWFFSKNNFPNPLFGDFSMFVAIHFFQKRQPNFSRSLFPNKFPRKKITIKQTTKVFSFSSTFLIRKVLETRINTMFFHYSSSKLEYKKRPCFGVFTLFLQGLFLLFLFLVI